MNLSSTDQKQPHVCFVHDWLVAMRGGEKVLETLVELFPDAPIYTLFFDRKKLSPLLASRKIHASFLQLIPRIERIYRWLLPFFPIAIKTFNLKQFDLVISSSHCVAKAVGVRQDAIHICYCHTPMRYLWGFEEEYLGRFPRFLRWLIKLYFKWLQNWDVTNSKKVTYFVSNSKNTAKKISALYDKESVVIHPPAEVKARGANEKKEASNNYFLVVSALVPYKRIDLVVEVFNQLEEPVRIIGDGPLKTKLEALTKSPKIQFEGWVSDKVLEEHYSNCRALIFPGEEDYGIVPVEVQLFGKPVIAFGKGGVLETVLAYHSREARHAIHSSTGLFFYEQTPQALMDQIKQFERLKFDSNFIYQHALQFSKGEFQRKFLEFLRRIGCHKVNHG